MRGQGNGPADHQWGRFGFLIADFFTLLAMLFLVANTIGTYPPPKPTATATATVTFPSPTIGTPAPTATPIICGLDPTPLPDVLVTISNASLLRRGDSTTERLVASQIRRALARFASKKVGLAIVWGGSINGSVDVGDGIALAEGAIASLKLLAGSGFMFTPDRTGYKPLWNGVLSQDQVQLTLYVYNVSLTTSCGASLT